MIDNIDDYIRTDDALFHYTSLSVGLEKILSEKKIKASQYINTNDPREYKYHLLNWFGINWSEKENSLLKNATPIFNQILKYNCKVICFCSNKKSIIINDENGEDVEDSYSLTAGWTKSRMWAQYGENHRGLAIVFSKTAIEKMIQKMKLLPNTSKTDFVKYTTSARRNLNAYTMHGNRINIEGAENYCKSFVLEKVDEFFFTKYVDHRDENECRVFIYDPDMRYEFLKINSIIKGVVAGDKTPKLYFPILKKLCKNLKIECRRITWDRGEPMLLLCNEAKHTT